MEHASVLLQYEVSYVHFPGICNSYFERISYEIHPPQRLFPCLPGGEEETLIVLYADKIGGSLYKDLSFCLQWVSTHFSQGLGA